VIPCVVALAFLAAPDEKPSYAPLKIADPARRPVIDGVLDDSIWSEAPLLDGLRQVEPKEGGEPTERTEVRVVYDDHSLFIGVLCRDHDPSTIRATVMKRDASLQPDDSIAILLDTFHDRRNAFYFAVGAAGGMVDALVAKNGAEFDQDWNGIWDARARLTPDGWAAEFEIPFATLNFKAGETTWGFNVQRVIRRGHEILRWASPNPRFDFDFVANAGTITGMTGMQQSLGLDVVPFAVGKSVHDSEEGRDYTKGQVGFDLYWRITPNFKLSLSTNTDFAETEVDDRKVNLTRFPLLFPEKRRFFLEDSNNFVFANGEESMVLPYFSRTIGLAPDGSTIPILTAAKFTGRTDDFSIGLMDVVTDAHGDIDRQNLVVGRYEQNLFDQSTAGVVFTSGDPSGATNSSTYGGDYNYRSDTFLGDRNLRFGTWFLRSDDGDATGHDKAYNAHVSYPNDEVEASFDWTVVEDHFAPTLGFVERTGIKQYVWNGSWNPRLDGSVRQLFFGVQPTVITDSGNQTETTELLIEPFGFETQEGDEGRVKIRRVYDHLDQDFEIVPGVTIPADGYHFTRYGATIESSSGRPWTLTSAAEFGPFYGGTETVYLFGLTVRPDKHVNSTVEWENDVGHLPGGDFDVRVTRFKLDLLLNPRVVWSNFVQYDNQSNDLGLNSRIWWIIQPGREVYLVLNQGWNHEPSRFAPTDTQLTLKVGYTLRF
jgi:hypothetical protein